MLTSPATRTRTVSIHRTIRDTNERVGAKGALALAPAPAATNLPVLEIDATQTFQELLGFGGSFTESSGFILSGLPQAQREEILRAYFDPVAGLGYTVCRTHINSCDFSLGNFAYAGVDGDEALEHFDISRDTQWLIPFIRGAMEWAESPLRIMASPWSPPAWMKTNGQMNHGGKLKPEYAATWARYFVQYIRAYERHGIPIWAVSVQNEPEALQVWDSCLWTAEEERDFIRDHLGPALESEELGHVKILAWDHNKDVIVERAATVLSDPETARYVWGVAFHWYAGDHFENLDIVHRRFPDKKLLFTEGCQEYGVHLGDWSVGERYGHEIIGDLNHWTVGFIDWNMLLDEQGGPNHVGNYCDAPIIVERETGRLHYQNSYYYIGHFSKFIKPGAVRIGCESEDIRLEATAFRNPDGHIAVVVMNRSDETLSAAFRTNGAGAILDCPPHSIQTLLYEANGTDI